MSINKAVIASVASLLPLTLLSPAIVHGQIQVLTQKNDVARTGQNLQETTLNTSNVNVSGFGKIFYRTVDGFIYAQPLYVPGLTIQGATHNVVYVATEHNSVYAFDADNPNEPAPLWQVNLGTSVPSQDICIISGDTNPADCPYYDISPEIGITSTPAIDPVAGLIYVVARTKNTANNTYHDYLHALNLLTGADELGGPMEIVGQVNGTGTGSSGGVVAFQPVYQHQRPALLLENGTLYIGFGSVGDIGSVYHGWLMSYNASTLQQEAIWNVTPDGDDGGIWASGQGPVADSSGNVYLMTANGDFNANVGGGTDYGDSFIKFSGSSLAITDYFTPDTQTTLAADNEDLGSGGPMLMPGTSLLVGMGKDGIMRVVNTTNMGHYSASADNDVQEWTATPNAFFASPVYWDSPNYGPLIYIWGEDDYLKAFQYTGSKFNTTPVSEGTSLNSSGDPNAAAMSISADGSLAGTGILWATGSLTQWAKGTQVPGFLRAFDATNLTDLLFDSTQNLARDDVGSSAKLNPPTIDNGKVYVGSFSGQLQVYGLNPPAFQGVQFVQVASATPQSTTASVPVAFTSPQTAGDLNVVIVGWNDTTAQVQSVTDSAGNTYTLALGPTRGTGVSESIYYAKNIFANSANTVTVDFNQGATKPDIRILEYSGVATSSPLDVSAGASGDTYIADSGYVNTNAANELIVGAGMVQNNTTVMAGAPFTPRVITSPDSDLAEDRLVNVPGSYHSWEPLNATGNWVMQMVTFKSATTSTVPFVNSVTPNSGPISGGTAVTISGIDFATGDTVTFGGTAATNVTVVNSTTITATAPAESAGAVTVTVTNTSGVNGSLSSGYTYVAQPAVTGVSPSSGTTAGGTSVTITGTNFVSGDTVSFGGASATSVVVVSSTSITATTPAGTAGAVTVAVTNSLGQSGTLASGFTYVVKPAVTGVSPASGPVAGGTSVTITGSNFASGATVTFGSGSATNVVVVSSTSITATAPAGTAGAATVTVTVNGQSGSLVSGYTYIGTPTVTGVSPNNGPTTGGVTVTITGTNFATGATVAFGSASATNVVVVSGTSITATTPAGSVGAVTVTVTNPGSLSGSLASGYTYNAAVAIGYAQEAFSGPQSPTASVPVAYPAAQTAGDLNIVVVGWNDTTSTVQSVKDSAGNTYKLAVGATAGTGLEQSIYYASNIAGGTNTVAVAFSQAAAYPDVRILEYKGVTTLDVTAAATGSSAAPSSGSATTTSANELIFGADIVSTTTTAAGSGFTSRVITTPDGDIAEDKIVTVAGSNSATATLSAAGPWIMQMATFSAAPAPAPTVTGVSPNTGSTAGGTAVTITGTNFAAGASVTFGGVAATGVTVVSSTSITATTPAGTSGASTVAVTENGQSGSLASGFTYVVPPAVTSVTPNGGPLAGGTSVTITGTNFATGDTVAFGSTAATGVTVVNSTTITATTPAESAGTVTVTVTSSGGISGSLANAYIYAATPTITGVSPSSGSTAGGTAVTITGTNFAAGATVEMVETRRQATNVVVVNSTTITAVTPTGDAGAESVSVTVNGQSATLSDSFTYIVTPTVTSVSPASGTTAGGTSVTITGANFATGATVTFGSASATNVVVVSSTSITATTPAGSAGAVTVTVTSGGQSGSLSSGYTYVAQPAVTGVSPSSGTTAGGTSVTITGTNFVSGDTVSFGGASATSVVVVSSTSITATTPAGTAGAVTVAVTNSLGQSGTLASGFTYVVKPAVTGVSPASGPVAGGTSVTITGSNFASGATVTFGSGSATNVVVVSSTSITATAPAGTAGAATVTVTVNGQSGSLVSGYTYIGTPTVTGVSPNNGPTTGGVTVTITGTNFATGATVAFGSASATNVVVVSGTSITATTPAGSVGAVTVTVTNPGSLSGSLASGYTYNAAVAIGYAQEAFSGPQSPTASVPVAYPAAQTAGDLNIVVVGWNDTTSTVQSVKDSAGNTYKLAVGATAGTGLEQSIYYASNIAGGTNTVAVAFSQAAAYPDVRILEYKGVTTLDVTAAATGSSAAPSSGSATTTSANELIFGADIVSTTTTAAGSGFTSRVITTPDGDIAEDKIVTVAGSNSATATLSAAGPWIMQMATFSAAPAPAPTVTGVSPNTGSTAGGTAVTITGTNFAAGASVTFGGVAATGVTVVSSTSITATTPAGTSGASTVAVTENGQSGSLASGFTYVVPPAVTSVTPNGGPLAGGTSVTITGTNFATGDTVAFGSTAATGVTVVNSTTITATTPAESAGTVTVTVTSSGGISGSLANAYIYAATPTITGVSPSSGSTAGGTAVTITGTNFAAGATVEMVETRRQATNVVVVNSTTITAVTPTGDAGAESVSVTVNGQSATLSDSFTYIVTPTVTSVSPASGTTAGGTSVTITGANFATGATVTFGSASATNVVVVSSTSITATTPAGSAGAVTVTVTSGGQSGSLSSGYTYVAQPAVTGVSPSSGTTAGGTSVTITGTNFVSGDTVSFGGASATSVVVVSSTSITATTPAGTAGAVTVAVTNSLGQSGTLASGFTYVVKPAVTGVSPASGPVAGGTSVTITGSNFASGATVTFGSGSATNVVVVSSTSITATAPAGTAGAATVTVTVNGQSGSLVSGYTYIGTPTVTGVSPNNGPTTGGVTVTITGTNFATGATVAFGSASATNVVVVSGTSITATTPAGSVGAVTVTVTNPGSLSGSLASGYTYNAAVAIGYAQEAFSGPQSPTASVPVAYPAAQTAGDLNIVVVGWNDTTSTVQSVKDSAGNTYKLAVGATAGTGLEQSIYYASNIAGGTNTVAVAFSQAAAYPDVRILEYKGVTTLDVTAAATGSSAAPSSGSATTTSANELIFGADIVSTTTTAAGSGFTSRVITTPDGDIAEDKIVTVAGSNSATATLSAAGPWIMQMATFSAAPAPAPTVTGVSPNTGSTAGGTAVTITGTNFAAGASVTFGGVAATGVTVVSSTSITATTPAGTSGASTVAVTENGQSGSLASGFTYVVPPAVTSVTPNGGPLAGGTSVTITGTNFATGDTVAFGSTAATGVTVVNSTTITATTPAESAGTVTVTVTSSGGISGSLANAYIYAATPTITGVSPSSGSTAGGTAVTITGTNFAAGATVTFGGVAATGVTVVSSTSITATTPASTAGAVTVTVTNPGSQSGSLPSGYTYMVTTNITAPGNPTGQLAGTLAPTYVSGQEFYNATAGTSFTSAAFNSTGADLLVMFLGCHNYTVFTITDSYGNTWIPLAGPALKVGTAYYPMEGEFFYAPNATTGANHTVTVTLSQSEPLVMSITAFSGDNIYSPIDAYSSIVGDNGTISKYTSSNTLTTTQQNDMLVGIVKGFGNNTYTAGSGYTSQTAATGLNFSAETETALSAGNYSASFTASVSDFWQSVIGAIAPKPNESVLNWTPSTGAPIANYFIERCTGLSCSNFVQVGSVSGSTLTYTDTSIASGMVYNYRVRAEDTGGLYSGYSSVIPVSPIIPRIVSGLAATPIRTLSWNPSTENGGSISSYSIERCTGAGCTNFAQITTTTGTAYMDSTAAAGTTYNYRVRALDANGFYGPYSVVAAATIPAYFDNAEDGGNNAGTTSSLTFAYTVGTGANRLLLVSLMGSTSVDDISSVTYAGAAMTLVKKIQTPSSNWHYLYSLLSPASGTNNVVITAGSAHYLISAASSWFNVAQTAVPEAVSTSTAASGVSLTTSLPVTSSYAIVVESMWGPEGIFPGPGVSELLTDAAFHSLGIFSTVPSPVSESYPASVTNTFGGEGGASSIMASFALASGETTGGITYDNAADGGNNSGTTTSLTYSYKVGTGANRLLVVNLIGDTSADNISSVTYAGATMKVLGKLQASSNNFQYVYYLLNPASGSNNIVITAGTAHYLISEAASWYNVQQSAQPDAVTTNTALTGATSMTTSLTTVANGALVVQGLWSYGHPEAGPGADSLVIDAAIGGAGIFASTASPVSPAGRVSMTTISDGAQSSGVIMASFAPAP